jgi:hypothetical protein
MPICVMLVGGIVAVFIAGFPVVVGELPAGSSIAAQCSELSTMRDRLHAEIERLHAERAMVEAQLGALCMERANQTAAAAPLPLTVLSQSTGRTRDEVAETQKIVPQHMWNTNSNAEQPEHAPPVRRSGDGHLVYAVRCWGPSIAFSEPSCNCFGQQPHPKLDSRRTITIVVGSW